MPISRLRLLVVPWLLLAVGGLRAQPINNARRPPAAGVVLGYTRAIARADSLYWVGQYHAAAHQYERVLRRPAVKPLAWDWYEAARTQALSGDYLRALASLDSLLAYVPTSRWRTDPDFAPLHRFPHWTTLTQRADEQQAAAQRRVRNLPLAQELATLLQQDQATRQKTGMLTAAEAKQFFHQDSVHLVRLRQIVARHGWPGRDEIGQSGNEALFLLLLHSDNAAVLTEFLPVVRHAVQQGQTEAKSLAYLEDRLAMRQGKRQRYGTQFQQSEQTQLLETYPVENPAQVDVRRYAVGLPPLVVYVRRASGSPPVK